jgi:hypothetical protein
MMAPHHSRVPAGVHQFQAIVDNGLVVDHLATPDIMSNMSLYETVVTYWMKFPPVDD